MAQQYSNNTLKKQVKGSQQSSPLLSKTSQSQPLLPKIPQQSLHLPSEISQQSPLLPPKISQQSPLLLPKVPQQSPLLLPKVPQQSPLLHSKISQHPYEVYNYVEVPQNHYSLLRSETPEMNQFYSMDPYFNPNLTQFLTYDKEKEQSLLTKV